MSKARKPSGLSKTRGSKPVKNSPPHFLTIPLELREHVYAELILDDPCSLFQLLLTNRQVYREAKPFLFRQSLSFDGQAEFYEWIQTVDRAYLRYVVDIQFKLHDIDPENIVGALGKRLRQAHITAANSAQAPVGNPYHEACDLEIERLGRAFLLFPNVRRFTVLSSTDSDPRPSYHMLVAFSNLLAVRFPHLMSFTNQEEFLPVGFLSKMKNLQRFSFSGVTTSSPAEVTAVFQEFHSLVDLEISRLDQETSRRQTELYFRVAKPQQCNYGELMRCIPNLESLSFYGESVDEEADEDDEYAMPDLTKNFLAPLDGRGCPLQTLRILANVSAGSEGWMQKKIASFHTSRLVHLETVHAHLPPMKYLPQTLETLVLWTSESEVDIGASMKELMRMVGDFRSSIPRLAEIMIHLDVEDWDGVGGARRILCQRMLALGIRLRWIRWDGDAPK